MAEPKLAQVCINVPINPEILNTQYGKNLYNYLVGEGIAELITAYSEEEINPVLEGWLNTSNKFGRKKVFKSTDVAECIKIIRDTVLERDTSPEVSPTNIVQLSLEDERAQIFGEGSILELTRTKGFRTQMIQTFLVNESLNTLVSSNEELNESILNYKKQQFSAILECLKLYDQEWFGKHCLNSDGKELTYILTETKKLQVTHPETGNIVNKTIGIRKLNEEFINSVFTRFKEILPNISNSELLEQEHKLYLGESGISNETFVSNSTALYQATCAYLNLKYFDTNLKDNLGNIIGFTPNNKDTVILDNEDGSTNIKYIIGNDTSHVIKNWNIGEFRDALQQSAKITQLLLEALELYDWQTNVKQHSSVNLTTVSTSWNNLIDAIYELDSNDLTDPILKSLKESLLLSSKSPQLGIKQVFNLLFGDRRRNIVEKLINSNIVSLEDINVLYSLHKLFLSNQGIDRTENRALKSGSSVLKDFLIQDIIINQLQRVQKAVYWVNEQDSNGIISKELIKSDTIRNNLFSFKTGVNLKLNNQSQESRVLLKDSYNIQREGVGTIKLTLDGIEYTFKNKGDNNTTKSWVLNPRMQITYPIDSEIEQQILNQFSDNKEIVNIINSQSYIEEGFDKLKNLIKEYKITKDTLSEEEQSQNKQIDQLIKDIDPIEIYMNHHFGSSTVKEILKGDPKHNSLYNLFEFIKDTIGLDFSTQMGINTLSYFRAIKGGNLRDILSSAIRYVYLNNLALEADGLIGIDWTNKVISIDPALSDYTQKSQVLRKQQNRTIFDALGNPAWLDNYFIAEGIYTGEATRAVTKDPRGNNIANYRPASLGIGIMQNLAVQESDANELKKTNEFNPLASNLFISDRSFIKSIYYDTSMSTRALTVATKEATAHELMYNGFVHNCLNSFIQNDTMVVMPTVYSDKTSFISYAIRLDRSLGSKKLIDFSIDELEDLYLDTVGNYYLHQYGAIAKSFLTLFVNSNIDLSDPNLLELKYSKEQIELSKKDPNYKLQEYSLEDLREKLNNLNPNDFDVKNPLFKSAELSKIVNTVLQFGKVNGRTLNEAALEDLIRTYNESHPNNILQIALDGHYRVDKATKRLYMNELSSYYGERFVQDFSKRVKKEQKMYIKMLMQNNTSFKYSLGKNNKSIFQQAIDKGFIKIKESDFAKEWTEYGQMILAKDSNGNNIYNIDQLEKTDNIVINPLLEKYFILDNVISSNLKYALVGNEISDPLKAAGLNMEQDFNPNKSNTDRTNKSVKEQNILRSAEAEILNRLQFCTLGELQNIVTDAESENESFEIGVRETIVSIPADFESTLSESEIKWLNKYIENEYNDPYNLLTDEESVQKALFKQRGLEYLYYQKNKLTLNEQYLTTHPDTRSWYVKNLNYLQKKYNDLIYRVIATSEGSQYKRNVIIPATKSNMQSNAITGVSEYTKVAVIKDPKAIIFNPTGSQEDEDANDGSAKILPFQSILENGSLGVDKVNYAFKKPIWYHYDPTTGTSVLLKFATFATDNGKVRQSIDSVHGDYQLIKKMSNLQWTEDYDLCNSVLISEGSRIHANRNKLRFSEHILKTLVDGKQLIYEKGSHHYAITDFKSFRNSEGKNIYYTIEQEVNNLSGELIPGTQKYVMQLFDRNSNHNTEYVYNSEESLQQVEIPSELHSINSVFELWESLGSCYTETFKNGEWVPSENSNYAVVGFMNNVQQYSDNAYAKLEQVVKSQLESIANSKSLIFISGGQSYAITNIHSYINEDGNTIYYTEASQINQNGSIIPGTKRFITYSKNGESTSFISEQELKKSNPIASTARDLAKSLNIAFNGKVPEIQMSSLKLDLDQYYYKQPLKTQFIGYLAHSSAVKRGAFNMNSVDNLNNDKTLLYSNLRSNGLGTQQDPTHEADEAELTEMSQVIASLDAGGMMHPYAKIAFQELGKVTMSALKFNRDTLIDFIRNSQANPENKNVLIHRLYDIFARQFIKQFKGRQHTDLINAIIDQVKQEFNINDNHLQDSFKLPISDPNVFKQIVATFAGSMNNGVLRRKYSGIGDVMVPAYNRVMIYHLDNDNSDLTADDIYLKALTRNAQNNLQKTDIEHLITSAKKYNAIDSSSYIFTYESNYISDDGSGDLSDIAYNQLEGKPYGRFEIETNTFYLINNPDKLQTAQIILAARELIQPNQEIISEINLSNFGFRKLSNGKWIKIGLSNNIYHKLLMNAYLQDEQQNPKYIHTADWFQPTDGMDIVLGNFSYFIDFDNADIYYDFQDNPYKYQLQAVRNYAKQFGVTISNEIQTEGLIPGKLRTTYQITLGNETINLVLNDTGWAIESALGTEPNSLLKDIAQKLVPNGELFEGTPVQVIYRENIVKPKNLRPQRISFTLENGQRSNMYNLTPIKIAHKFRRNIKLSDNEISWLSKQGIALENLNLYNTLIQKGKNVSKQEKLDLKNITKILIEGNLPLIDQVLINLEDNHIVTLDGQDNIPVTDIDNQAAEMMMSDIYSSKFNMGNGTLNSKLEDIKHITATSQSIKYCDLILQKNGESVGVSFSPELLKESSLEASYFYQNVEKVGDISRIYKTGKSRTRNQCEIGYYKVLDPQQYKFTTNGEIFQVIGNDVKPIYNSQFKIVNNRVVQEIHYVQQYTISKIQDGQRVVQPIYYFDEKAIDEAIKSGIIEGPKEQFIANLLNKLIIQSDFTYLQLNNKINTKSSLISDILNKLEFKGNANIFLNRSIKWALYTLQSTDLEKQKLINKGEYKIKGKNTPVSYITGLNFIAANTIDHIKSNYQLAQYFTVARIPAQSLQSYMQMRNVGYIRGNSNEIMVSHWQTWLQGSDYSTLDHSKVRQLPFQFKLN